MQRRDVLAFVLASFAAPRAAWAQAKVYRIAWLSGSAVVPGPMYDVFVAAMRDLGWVEGRNYSVDNLLYEGHSERLAVIAADAVARKFDLIICAGTPPTVAAKKATSTIPIVFYFLGDPIGSGVVASFAHPGGNVTGLGGLGPGIYTKMLELLKEAAPKATRVAMLVNSTFSLHAGFFADAEAAARLMRLTLRPVEVRSPDDMDSAFATVKREKPDALLILGQPFLVGQGPRVAKFAIEQRLRRAIQSDEFELFYQPLIDIETHDVALVEALLRWRTPDGSNAQSFWTILKLALPDKYLKADSDDAPETHSERRFRRIERSPGTPKRGLRTAIRERTKAA